jgi:hypothetical protein
LIFYNSISKNYQFVSWYTIRIVTGHMSLLSEEQKSNIKLVWFNILQALYNFPPIQRVLLVFGILALIPGYWLTRVAAKTYYNWDYGKRAVAAHRSFENPRQLTVDTTDIFTLDDGRYVAYAKITNPNLDLAGYVIPYTVAVNNSKKERMYRTSGQTYVLPGESQYITTSAFQSPSEPVEVVVEFGDVHWQKRLAIPQVRLATPAVTFSDAAGGLQLEGSVVNNSPYELASVRLTFLLYDTSGKIIGVTQRDELSVRPNTRRTFPQMWPAGILAREVSKVTPIASTNSLDAKNLNVEAGSTHSPVGED